MRNFEYFLSDVYRNMHLHIKSPNLAYFNLFLLLVYCRFRAAVHRYKNYLIIFHNSRCASGPIASYGVLHNAYITMHLNAFYLALYRSNGRTAPALEAAQTVGEYATTFILLPLRVVENIPLNRPE